MTDTAAAILDEMVASARRHEALRSVSAVLKGIDPKAFYRARETGWFGGVDFHCLLNKCEDHMRSAFRARWYALRERRRSEKQAMQYQRAVEGMSLSALLRAGNKDAAYWSALADALMSPISGGSRLSRPEETSLLLEFSVERYRQVVGQEQGLKNALILMRAALTSSPTNRASSRLMLLSIIVSALKLAALLGHKQAHRWIRTALEDLHKAYPSDDHVHRVLLCCLAIDVFHYKHKNATSAARRALELHSQEASLAARCIQDHTFATDWPIIYREVRGPMYNIMNVRIDVGVGVALNGRFFHQHRDWQAITEENLPPGFRLAENPSLAVETAAYDVRLRAGALLDRPNRSRSLRYGNPEQALAEVDNTLNSPATTPLINQLTNGHLLALRAEALLCLYADERRPTRKEEYLNSRDAALSAYRDARDQANSDMWLSRIKTLEEVTSI